MNYYRTQLLKIIFIIVFVVSSFSLTQGQTARKFEFGFNAGVSYYVGDLNPTGHFFFPNPGGGITAKYVLDNRWAFRAGFSYFRINASDDLETFGYQGVRNLSFENQIFELHIAAELNFFPFRLFDKRTRRWTPYFMAGLGAYYHNPQSRVNGNLVSLQPLGTEGQGTASMGTRPYSLFQPVLPFGLGVKFNIGNKFTLGIEYGVRLTPTDYLDDVSNTYGVNGEIVALHGTIAGQLSDQSTGPYSVLSNDLYQRGIKTDLDWYGYLGINLMFRLTKPPGCSSGF